MIVLVCGSRSLDDARTHLRVWRELDVLASQSPDGLLVVHGDAKSGPDAMADAWAHASGQDVEPHPADWDRYGKRAGFVRNLEMLNREPRPDIVLAFWDGRSRGTLHTINSARARGIPILVFSDAFPKGRV